MRRLQQQHLLQISTHDNYESGFQLQGSSSGNQILNLDRYGNPDPRKNGESADGLAIKEGSGTGNVVRGARLWSSVDDGFDAWKFASPILIENTIAYGVTDNGNPGAQTLTRNTTWAHAGTGNSWNLGGTWNAASVLSTDPGALTGPRSSHLRQPGRKNWSGPFPGTPLPAGHARSLRITRDVNAPPEQGNSPLQLIVQRAR